MGKTRSAAWAEGFSDGAWAVLAVVRHMEGLDSTMELEIVRAFGYDNMEAARLRHDPTEPKPARRLPCPTT